MLYGHSTQIDFRARVHNERQETTLNVITSGGFCVRVSVVKGKEEGRNRNRVGALQGNGIPRYSFNQQNSLWL